MTGFSVRLHQILIIDDEETRNEPYRLFLGPGFALDILNNIDLNRILQFVDDPEVDCILLDMVLNSGRADQQKELFQSVIEIIGKKKPIILTSRNFGNIVSWINNLNQHKGYEVIYYFGWDELYRQDGSLKDLVSADIMRSRIEMALNNFYKRTNSKKLGDESINVLHISDLQFGDPNFSNDAKILSERLIAEYIISNLKKKIDFIAVTGDIAYSGLPSEFNEGHKWLTNLVKYLFPTEFHNYGERILIVPGNHDVNLALSAADYLKYNFKFEQDLKLKDRLIDREPTLQDHQQIALSPFVQFAYKLSRDPSWLDNETRLCFINTKYSKWGIQFVHLNTVMDLGFLDPDKISLAQDPIGRLGHSIHRSQRNLFTIYLAHNGPEDLGFIRSADHPESVTALFSLINTVGGNLFLHGHRHKIERLYDIPFEGKYSSNIKYGQTGSVSLNKKVQSNGSRRGFSIVELSRENGLVNAYSHKCFEFNEQEISEVEKKATNITL